MIKIIKKIIILVLILIIVLGITVFAIDDYVKSYASNYIVKASELEDADAVLVLGAYVDKNGIVSVMLKDRLETGLDVFKQGKAPKIIVSGDHGKKDYDEVNAMKKYLLDKGVSDEDIFMDHAGFNTYESMYRAKEVFLANKIIIVTQQYHLMRAVFIARQLGIDAYGVAADKQNYGSVMTIYNIRETLARVKDFLNVNIFKPKPTFLGEEIPVSGDARQTNDKKY